MLKCLNVDSEYATTTTTTTTTTVTAWRRTKQELVYSETWRTASRATPTRVFLVCSSTQKCSSKEICAALVSEMCSWHVDNISTKGSVNFLF